VVNEGIRDAAGRSIHEHGDASQRDAMGRNLPGDVAHYLAGVITRELKIRCRSEKPGICGRASMLHVSAQDRADAELVGRAAVRGIVEGRSGDMVSLTPLDAGGPRYCFVRLSEGAGKDRAIPGEWLSDSELSVNEQFINYIRPIVGDLVEYAVPLKDQL
jgi:ATP-dependent phosphofructokinase / diphosphate-dependent phosphofructokinase